MSIAIDGPRQSLGRYRFESEQQLLEFEVALAERLTERGWLLCRRLDMIDNGLGPAQRAG